MKKLRYAAFFLVIILGSFLAGSWHNQRQSVKGDLPSGRRILYYVDPMNPAHTSDKPGLAPCGMKMEPVYADEGTPGQAPGTASSAMPRGTVRVTPEKQQLIGVRVASVERAPGTRTVRLFGKVVPDELRMYSVIAGTDGWIMKVAPVTTGSVVAGGDLLATFYSWDLTTRIQSYTGFVTPLQTRFGVSESEASKPPTYLPGRSQSYKNSLRTLGISEHQLDEIDRTRRIPDEFEMRAPGPGLVIARNVSVEKRFQKGDEFFRIADLSRVWVLADLFENEIEYVRPGTEVKLNLPNQRKALQAMVSEVLPQFDATTRTMKVRLEVDNPDYLLRPDMFVDVELPVEIPETLSVPADAVLDSGVRKTVFVDRGNGFFEPRRVETGGQLGDRIEILKGLMPGERVVVSANFLLDSESRMKMAAAGLHGTLAEDPVCGMDVDEAKAAAAGLKSEYGEKTYYFCMEECKQKFDQEPERYMAAAPPSPGAEAAEMTHRPETRTPTVMSPHGERQSRLPAKAGGPHESASTRSPTTAPTAPATAKDPVCGMDVDEKKAEALGLRSEYQGKTYYFCMEECKERFEQDPEHYAGVSESEPEAAGDHKGHPQESRMEGGATGQTQKVPGRAGGVQGAGDALSPSATQAPSSMARDPVCGMYVLVSRAGERKSEYQGKTYYFCRDQCKQRFDQEPGRYLSKGTGPGARAGQGMPPTMPGGMGHPHD